MDTIHDIFYCDGRCLDISIWLYLQHCADNEMMMISYCIYLVAYLRFLTAYSIGEATLVSPGNFALGS